MGTISLGYDDPPDAEEVLFLEAIAGQAAQTLLRLRLAERDRRRRAAEVLGSLAEAALDATDHLELMKNITTAAVPTLGDWCAIHYLPEDGGAPEVVVAHVDPARVAWAEELRLVTRMTSGRDGGSGSDPLRRHRAPLGPRSARPRRRHRPVPDR